MKYEWSSVDEEAEIFEGKERSRVKLETDAM